MDYLLKSSICMTAFYGLYFFGFRRLSFHALNRFYLLVSLALSLTIPMINYEREEVVIVEPSSASDIAYSETISTQSFDNQAFESTTQVINPQETEVDWLQITSTIYLLGVIIMLSVFFRNLILIVRMLVSSPPFASASLSERIRVLVTERSRGNASFFNYIFINPDNLNQHEQALIIAHESFHAKQLHTVDLLLLGILKAIFWFNPIVYFYQKSLKQIHEYEVDALMSATHDSRDYAHLLLKLGVGTNSLIINQFSTKPLSDRIQFLFTKPTKNMKKLLYFFVIPIIGVGVMAFAQEKVKMVYQEKFMSHESSIKPIEVKEITPEMNIVKGEKMGLDTLRQNTISHIDSSKFSYQFSFSDFKLSKADIDSFKVSVNNQLLIEGKDFIVKANKILLDPKYKGSKTHLHIYSSTGSGGKLLYPELAKLEELPLLKINLSSKLPSFFASNDNRTLSKTIKIPFPDARPIKSQDTLRTIVEANRLGKNPLVIINGEEYPSSILTRIDPTKFGWSHMAKPNDPKYIAKYGEKAKDGFIEIRTIDDFLFKDEKTHQIAVENVRKQLQPTSKRVRRLILQDADGKDVEQISLISEKKNYPHATVTFPVGSTVLFILDGEIVSEEVLANNKQDFISVSASSKMDKKIMEKFGEELKKYDTYFIVKTKRD